MVRDVELKHSRESGPSATISLTLLNSRLQGSKQINLSLQEMDFALLGPLNQGNTSVTPLNTLQNRLGQLGISPYSSSVLTASQSSVDPSSNQTFDYMKLREIQNIQWA